MRDKAAKASVTQFAVMAAIVATLIYFPLGLALIFVFRLADIGFETLITFGGALGVLVGLVAWWLLAFAGALVYVAFMLPWEDKVFGWPKKR